MARVIAVAVPKGGTGKTTTVQNLGVALARRGQRVLVLDFDPSGGLSKAFGVQSHTLAHTSYTALQQFLATFEPHLEAAIVPMGAGIDLVPTGARLNLANDQLVSVLERERVLRELLAPLQDQYDFVLIDTLPYQGILVLNALMAAGEVLIPLEPEYLASESVELILDQVELLRKRGSHPTLRILGILLTQVDKRTTLHREAVQYVREVLGRDVPVFQTIIPRTITFPDSQKNRVSIFEYDPKGLGAKAYEDLAEEVLRATT